MRGEGEGRLFQQTVQESVQCLVLYKNAQEGTCKVNERRQERKDGNELR